MILSKFSDTYAAVVGEEEEKEEKEEEEGEEAVVC